MSPQSYTIFILFNYKFVFRMKDLTSGNIWKQIIFFTLPLICSNLMMLSYQFVDSFIVGQVLGKEALAAVSQSYPVLFCLIALMIGLGSGTIVVISQYYGARKFAKVQSTSDTIHIIFLIVGLIISILGSSLSGLIFSFLGTPVEVMDEAVIYMRIYLGGIVLSFGFYTISSLLRGIGDSVTPMYMFLGSSILNIVLDVVLIVFMGCGVWAAAAGTIASQAIAYFITIIYINEKKSIFKIRFHNMRIDETILKQCLKYGLPSGIQQFFVAFANIIIMGFVTMYGTEAIAGYGAGIRIESIALLPVMNFSSAISVFVGHNVGARMTHRLRNGLLITLTYTLIFAAVSAIIIQLFSYDLVELFSPDSLVIFYGNSYLKFISWFYGIYAVMFIISGYLKGSGAVDSTMLITFISMWVIEIPLAYFLTGSYGINGIWYAIVLGWAIGCICMVLYYLSGRWKNKSVHSSNFN